MSGLQEIPLRIPDTWDPYWFERFIREVLAFADVRNAQAGVGIQIEGSSDTLATISGSDAILALAEAPLVLAEAEPALENGRILQGQPGVIEIEDRGPGSVIRVNVQRVAFHNLPLIPNLSLVGAGSPDAPNPTSMQVVESQSDNTVARRVDGGLDFGPLTMQMFPGDAVPDEWLETPKTPAIPDQPFGTPALDDTLIFWDVTAQEYRQTRFRDLPFAIEDVPLMLTRVGVVVPQMKIGEDAVDMQGHGVGVLAPQMTVEAPPVVIGMEASRIAIAAPSVTLGGGVWTPADITTAQWLDATDASTLSLSGDDVTEWRDKSGGEFHMSSFGAFDDPSLDATGIGGLLAVFFDTDQEKFASARPLTGACSVYCVLRRPESSSMAMIFGDTTSDVFGFAAQSGTGSSEVHRDFGSPATYIDGVIPDPLNRVQLYNLFDGNAVIAAAVGASLAEFSAWGFAATFSGWHINAWIGELVVVSGTDSTADRQRMEGYLAHKWGLAGSLPAEHPHKDDPPES